MTREEIWNHLEVVDNNNQITCDVCSEIKDKLHYLSGYIWDNKLKIKRPAGYRICKDCFVKGDNNE